MYPGERLNGYSHLLGLVLALAATALLLAKTLPTGDAARIAGALVFSLSAVVLYAASTLFHSTRGRRKRFWERVDHCAIYLLIAGTYTPFALVTLHGLWGWLLMAAVWGAAFFGIGRELLQAGSEASKPPLALYIAMGWLGVLAAVPLAARLDSGGLAWLLTGGVLYTAGTVFYRNRRGFRHAHGTWHLFVLAGTASHFVAVGWFVL
ncbi:PAQR family membrane homeostasis protein TrhA [Variovorax paradoxus]|jgi:hemolysin III|uniref:PAQR family membrane homeostasis protein TrhA n=1 Tax=Variovorax paradoxus TaxID=34073 RepID=UPI0029C8A099|nr:hemolysin III family protein [Variovorax paradoxus]WPH18679.1 hemolysin III family protein [Variovorax paradoxus]